MMQQPSKWITLAAAVGAITLGLATAQAYNLNGRVICPNGTVYPGVEVIVTLNGNEIASTTTDQNGD